MSWSVSTRRKRSLPRPHHHRTYQDRQQRVGLCRVWPYAPRRLISCGITGLVEDMSAKAPAWRPVRWCGSHACRDGGMQPAASREILAILERNPTRSRRLMREAVAGSEAMPVHLPRYSSSLGTSLAVPIALLAHVCYILSRELLSIRTRKKE